MDVPTDYHVNSEEKTMHRANRPESISVDSCDSSFFLRWGLSLPQPTCALCPMRPCGSYDPTANNRELAAGQ